jgi:dihydrofolate reductase
MEIIIIAAMAENRVIGKNNALPWSIREDMAHFKKLTAGFPCVMGRKTWESLPRRPLPGRLNIVISSTLPPSGEPGAGVKNADEVSGASYKVFPSLREGIDHCRAYEKVFICGGARLYQEAMALAGAIELTLVHGDYEGDARFPNIDPARWIMVASEDHGTFSFIRYNKKQ